MRITVATLLLTLAATSLPARAEDPAEQALVLHTDVRQIAVAAALVVGGYRAPASDPAATALRETVRTGLARLDPTLRERLEQFYAAHRRKNADGGQVDEASDALRYRALAMLMNPPPSFSIQIAPNRIPADLRELVGFAPLVGELFRSAEFRAMTPKLVEAYDAAGRKAGVGIGPTVAEILTYLRTRPVERVEVPTIRDKEGKIVRAGMTRLRRLKVFVDPMIGGQAVAVRGDLLDASDDVATQRLGDRYAVFAGPLLASDDAALRLGVFRFMIEPVVDRHRGEIDEGRGQIDTVVKRSATATSRYGEARQSLMTDSLVSALEARHQVRSKRITENQAVAWLGDAQMRGEVLALHIYDRLKRFEEVGIDIAVFFPEFVRSLDADRERTRDEEVAAARKAAATEPRPAAAPDAVAADILTADRLITEKRFGEARPILERVLQASEGNARALFGLAQVIENEPDAIERDQNSSDEDRASAQAERLETAVNLYRKAALNASSRELWLASWSHVYAGRILDFLDLRDEAVAEYQAAVKVGDVPQGAFKQAQAGLAAPYEPGIP
jgi:hypothetical protein